MFKNLKVIAAVAVSPFFLGSVASAQTSPFADIVPVVDESGSMAGEHAFLGDAIPDLNVDLVDVGLSPNRYGLVGFGSSGVVPREIGIGNGGTTQFGTAEEFRDNGVPQLLLNGGTEDGYAGIDFALSNYTYRSNASKNIILVTDEDRDNTTPSLTFNSILNSLNSQNTLLNAIVNQQILSDDGMIALGTNGDEVYIADGQGGFTTDNFGNFGFGFGTTTEDYADLAIATGGAVWDLNQLRAGGATAESFAEAFINVKVEEITNGNGPKQVPEPGTILGLLTISVLGLTTKLKKQV